LQKINLAVYLNFMQILLQSQQDVIDGNLSEVPKTATQNLAIAFQILNLSSGIATRVNRYQI
jgi:hypothetical protein